MRPVLTLILQLQTSSKRAQLLGISKEVQTGTEVIGGDLPLFFGMIALSAHSVLV